MKALSTSSETSRLIALQLSIAILAACAIAGCVGASRPAPCTPSSARHQGVALSTEQQVRQAVADTYCAPTGRAVIIGDYALVEWYHKPSLGHTAGQAVLIETKGRWRIVAAGGASYTALEVQDFGVPGAIARRLVADMKRK